MDCGRLVQRFKDEDFAVQISMVKAMGMLARRGDSAVIECLLSTFDDPANVNFLLEAMQAVSYVSPPTTQAAVPRIQSNECGSLLIALHDSSFSHAQGVTRTHQSREFVH